MVLWFLALLLLPIPVFAARTIPLGATMDRPLPIRLGVGEQTAVVFPEPLVSIHSSLNRDSFSYEQQGPYLFFTTSDPELRGRLFVVGKSGLMYLLTLSVVPRADDVVYITPHTPAKAKTAPFTATAFLRALRLDKAVPGMVATDVPMPTTNDARMSLEMPHALAVDDLIGWTVFVRNTQAEPLTLDLQIGGGEQVDHPAVVSLQSWVWPPRLTIRAVSADAETLEPNQTARLYIIYERR